MNWFEYEKEMQSKGYNVICGVDEAGEDLLQDLFLPLRLFSTKILLLMVLTTLKS